MKLQQLRYAIEIEKCGSLSKAAKRLFVSQPNLSNAIKDLEIELGISIFKRNNRGVQVTEKGATFLNYARSVLAQSLGCTRRMWTVLAKHYWQSAEVTDNPSYGYGKNQRFEQSQHGNSGE